MSKLSYVCSSITIQGKKIFLDFNHSITWMNIPHLDWRHFPATIFQHFCNLVDRYYRFAFHNWEKHRKIPERLLRLICSSLSRHKNNNSTNPSEIDDLLYICLKNFWVSLFCLILTRFRIGMFKCVRFVYTFFLSANFCQRNKTNNKTSKTIGSDLSTINPFMLIWCSLNHKQKFF